MRIRLRGMPEWVSINPGAVVLAKVLPLRGADESVRKQALGDPDSLSRLWASHQLLDNLIQGGDVARESEEALVRLIRTDPSPYVRSAVLSLFQRSRVRWLPESIAKAILELVAQSQSQGYEHTELYHKDQHGWREFRSELIGVLGKVGGSHSMLFLTQILQKKELGLDDLGKAAYAVGAQGEHESARLLHQALALHQRRGYRFRLAVLYGFGAYEHAAAASELEKLFQTESSDFITRLVRIVSNNQTLKNCREWASVMERFLLENDRFSDEIKFRMLAAIEDIKSAPIEEMLRRVVAQTASIRLRDNCAKILKKNFQSSSRSSARSEIAVI